MHNVYSPLQTCETQHKLSTTLSCHVQTTVHYAGGHCMLLYRKISQQYRCSAAWSTVCVSVALKFKDWHIKSHSHSHILRWFERTFTLQRNMLIREAVNSIGTSVTSARQHDTNHIPKYGYLCYRIKFMWISYLYFDDQTLIWVRLGYVRLG